MAATRSTPARKAAAKPRTAANATPRKAAAKKTTAKKVGTKKAAAKKAAPDKVAAKKHAARRPAAHAATATKAAPGTTSAAPAKANRAVKKIPARGSASRRLAGGNPQIPKGDGDAPVQAYIAAMPGWKQPIGRALDTLVGRLVPQAAKAVKWNTPLYGNAGDGWFMAFHCFDRYVKVTFFRGRSLQPLPPEGSKTPHTRYLHLHEGDDPARHPHLADWITQASGLPGERM